ncbi:hypothetical protein DQ04_08061000 [Trypanosoma grayi]|uniref:hypothetical protein n=1 Tax=Trypanosoma grayi TaxID=71804 RepID=UPI0004F4B722|nr:hypothetical protein DQ04_08061000 [Trypanosoma grayi]KEG08076.1 hypothetical protein DQ04_08061000 [Trypanosoma grayi]
MRPFQMRPPVADGARRLLPADSIMRLMNTVAAKYPGGVVLDVLEQCMRSLVPKRRWAEQRHHMACIALFLHLALEAHIPLYPAHDWGEDHLLGNNNNDVADTSKGAVGNASFRGSEDSGTDAGASSASHRKDCLRPLEMTAPMMSASDADFSDASISLASPTGVHPFATRFTEFTTQNNRMLAYRNELIRFVLQQLLNMELSLQSSDGAPLQDLASSSTSLGCCGNTTDSIRVLAGPSFGRVKEQSLEKPFVEILRNSTSLVFHRLAEDLMRQQTAGVCGNAEWWRELLAFHLTSVLKMECPICLLYLAPSLALLGGEEEAIDMMHKLVSVVTKGYQPVQQNTWRAAAAGPARVRMAPPSVGPLMIPMAHRVRAAAYLYPLFHFLRERLGNGEGTRKRLLKWVVQELRNTTLSSSHSLSSPSLLVQVLFAQCAAMSQLLGADFIEEIKSHAPDSKLLKSLMDKYLLPQGVERRMADEGGEGPPSAGDPVSCSQQLDLAQMEADGLLHTQLMGSCPWDWRRCQGGRDADR